MRQLVSLVISRHLPTAQKAVLVALAEHANKSCECWPKVALLAVEAGLSERQTYRTLAELETAGLVQRTPRTRAGGSTSSNLYWINRPAVMAVPTCAAVVSASATTTPPSCHGDTPHLTDRQGHMNQSLNQSIEPMTEKEGRVAAPISLEEARMKRQQDDGPETFNPFAESPEVSSARGKMTWVTVAKDFEEEASRFYPMRPNRTNRAAVAGALKREATRSGLTHEVALSMIDAFFWDRRHIVENIPLWRQFLASLDRLSTRARATVSDAREDRQGVGDHDLPREPKEYDPFEAQNKWLAEYRAANGEG